MTLTFDLTARKLGRQLRARAGICSPSLKFFKSFRSELAGLNRADRQTDRQTEDRWHHFVTGSYNRAHLTKQAARDCYLRPPVAMFTWSVTYLDIEHTGEVQ